MPKLWNIDMLLFIGILRKSLGSTGHVLYKLTGINFLCSDSVMTACSQLSNYTISPLLNENSN